MEGSHHTHVYDWHKTKDWRRTLRTLSSIYRNRKIHPSCRICNLFPCGINNVTDFSVTASQNALKKTCGRLMPWHLNFFWMYGRQQMLLFFDEHIHGILRFPLKRSVRLRNKWGYTYADGNTFAFRLIWITVIKLNHLLSKLGYSCDIVKSFRWQAHHKIQLYGSPSACKSLFTSVYNLFFRYVFVNGITQSLRTGFRRKRKTAAADFLSSSMSSSEKLSTLSEGSETFIFSFSAQENISGINLSIPV